MPIFGHNQMCTRAFGMVALCRCIMKVATLQAVHSLQTGTGAHTKLSLIRQGAAWARPICAAVCHVLLATVSNCKGDHNLCRSQTQDGRLPMNICQRNFETNTCQIPFIGIAVSMDVKSTSDNLNSSVSLFNRLSLWPFEYLSISFGSSFGAVWPVFFICILHYTMDNYSWSHNSRSLWPMITRLSMSQEAVDLQSWY